MPCENINSLRYSSVNFLNCMGNVCLCFKSSKNGHPYRVNVMLNKPVYVRECSIFTLWRNSCVVVLGARFEPVATGAIHDAHTKKG